MIREITNASRPPVTSYDSGHEHSLEHWLETQALVEESAETEKHHPLTLVTTPKEVIRSSAVPAGVPA